MEEVLYVKVGQNNPVKSRTVMFRDIGSFYCTNKSVVQHIEKEIFYTLPNDAPQKNMFTISKVYEGIHKHYPNLTIENLGEKDFIIDYEGSQKRELGRGMEYFKTALVSVIILFGAAFTIMTFNEDVSVGSVFDKVYELIMGSAKSGGSIVEVSYAIGLPVGILVFYNHFRRRKVKEDPTPLQVEMHTYEEQVNKALIARASREGHTIDSN